MKNPTPQPISLHGNGFKTSSFIVCEPKNRKIYAKRNFFLCLNQNKNISRVENVCKWRKKYFIRCSYGVKAKQTQRKTADTSDAMMKTCYFASLSPNSLSLLHVWKTRKAFVKGLWLPKIDFRKENTKKAKTFATGEKYVLNLSFFWLCRLKRL